jgi:hypothetical protein
MSGRTLTAATIGLVLSATFAQAQVPAAQGRAAKPVEIIERGPASSPDASHIDGVKLREERAPGRIFIVQEIVFYSRMETPEICTSNWSAFQPRRHAPEYAITP